MSVNLYRDLLKIFGVDYLSDDELLLIVEFLCDKFFVGRDKSD